MTITGEESTATVFHHGKSAEAVVFQLIDPFGMMKPFSQLLLRCGLFPVCSSIGNDAAVGLLYAAFWIGLPHKSSIRLVDRTY